VYGKVTDTEPSTESVRDSVVTDFSLACPATTTKTWVAVVVVTLPNTSVVVDTTAPSNAAPCSSPTMREPRLPWVSAK
jgi:hypothetical protein